MWRALFIALLLSGCAGVHTASTIREAFIPQKQISNPPTIRNQNCIDRNQFKVMQVVEYGVLAHLCPIDFPSFYRNAFDACMSEGDLIFIPVSPSENDYVDDQKVTLAEDQCIMENGTYRYETKSDIIKTVRKIRIIDSQVPNPRYKSDEKI